MIIGSRYLPQHIVRMKGKSFLETRLSIWAQYLTRFLLKIQVCDISHSLRVFRREVFTKVEPFLECQGNAMMIEFTFYTVRCGFKIKEIPVSYGKRLHGETKLGILKEGTRLLKVLRKLRKHFSTKGKTPP
jgi:dolichol-phosphate mannosyltransferase